MKTSNKWMVVVILTLFFLLALPVGAQTELGQAAATDSAAQQEVDSPVVIAVATEESSGSDVTVIVNNPPADGDTGNEGDTPNNESASSPLYYGIVVVLALLLVATLVFGGHIVNALKTMVPPETAASIYQSGVRFGLQVALNQAAQTPSPLDDEFFTEMAMQRGLQVIKRIDGKYEVVTPPAPSAG